MMDDERWMSEALREAEKALDEGEVPVGAVVVDGDRVIGRGYNRVESLRDPTAHAEIIAITAASEHKKDWRLDGATIYVTLEPCPMCGGAIILSRMRRVVYGVADPRMGCCGSTYRLLGKEGQKVRIEVRGGVLEEECRSLIQSFFKKRRSRVKNR